MSHMKVLRHCICINYNNMATSYAISVLVLAYMFTKYTRYSTVW